MLQYTPDPAGLLRRARDWLRPGGVVAFQEIDLTSPPRAYPTGPLHEQVVRWTTPPPGRPGYAYVAATVRSLLPFLERAGAVSAEEVGIDTLEDRLRAEVVGQDGVQLLPAVVGAWARS